MHWYLQFLVFVLKRDFIFPPLSCSGTGTARARQITQLCWPHTIAEPRRYVYACWSAHFSCLFWVLLWFVGGGGQNENLRMQPKYPSCLSSNRIRQEIKVRARHILKKKISPDWCDSPVSKVLNAQTWRPMFDSQNSCKMRGGGTYL